MVIAKQNIFLGFSKMNTAKRLDLIAKYLDNLSKSENDRNELYLFIS